MRRARFVLVCALAPSVGGCFEQHSLDQQTLTRVGNDERSGRDAGDEGDAGLEEPSSEDAGPTAPGIPGLPTAEQCADVDPMNRLLQLLCAAADALAGGTPAGGIIGGNGTGGITLPTPLECVTSKDPLTQLVCGLLAAAAQGGGTPAGGLLGGGGNVGGGATPGGFPISIPTAEDCADLSKATFITRILCAFVTSENGFNRGISSSFDPPPAAASREPGR